MGWLDAYLLFGLVDALQVTAGYVGAVEGLSHVFSVARQDLALEVSAHRLDVVAPAGGQRSGEKRWDYGRQGGGTEVKMGCGSRRWVRSKYATQLIITGFCKDSRGTIGMIIIIMK